MSLAKLIDGVASAFCAHEWASCHERERWYLECIKCRTTTEGIQTGRGRAAQPPAHAATSRPAHAWFRRAQRAA